jgi:pregnancy-associated plasma protein-A/type IX secretion system substrate protein
MKKNLLIITLSACFIGTIEAQVNRCGTMQYMAAMEAANPQITIDRNLGEMQIQQLLQNNPDYKAASVITIPVVFHILYFNTTQNIPDARIFANLDVLNDDFGRQNADTVNTPAVFKPVGANTNVQFCLATQNPSGNPTTGIIRIQTTSSTFPSNYTTISPEWDHTHYLNIYVGNLGNGLLGISSIPPASAGSDHVRVLYSAVGGPAAPGTFNPYHLGRTITHEVGHWVGLYHTFQGGCAGTTANNCNTQGDLVCDTPPEASSTFGCPSLNPNTCTEVSPFPPPYTMDMPDMIQNYMDYTDDPCMNIFSLGQKARMNAIINQYRAAINLSAGCVPVGIKEHSIESFVSVHPNPSDGNLTLNSFFSTPEKISVKITDLSGRIMYADDFKINHPFSTELNLMALPGGFYFLNIHTDKGSLTKKLEILR